MEYFHLTTPQQNIWNLQKYYSDTAIANLCGATFYGELRDSGYLQQAIRQFIQNQSGIRMRFCMEERPVQFVSDDIDENIPVMTFSSMEEFDRYAEKFACTPLDLAGRFQYRFVVFHVENRSGILVLLSHLISDAWTFGLLAKQLDEAYHKLAGDRENAESISLIQADYVDYIHSEEAYLSSQRYTKDKMYWEEKYGVRPEESLMKSGPALPKTIKGKRLVRALPFSLEQKMNAFCRTNSVTSAVLFETALIIYLYRINQENTSVTIGVPVLNRSNAREKEIAGMFVSTMPLTVTLTGDMTGMELARQIAKEHMNIFRHQKYPYAGILQFLREKHKLSGNLFGAMISYQNAKTDTWADTKWYGNGASEVPFVMHIDNRDGNSSHTVSVDYQTEVFQEEEIGYILKRLEYILEQISENGNEFIRDMDIVPKQERNKIIGEFNDTYVDYPREKCIHELFSEQVEQTPDKIALVFEDQEFTYKQLDEMSNSLAHYLREKGVKPNDVVPIIAKRSWHVIVAMLGVLKAGGAYMPIDPDYPIDRIRNMEKIAKSKITLQFNSKVNNDELDLARFSYSVDVAPVKYVNKPEDSAYVIFTSGSTGEPKGITICHRNISNYVHNNIYNKICHEIIAGKWKSIVSVTNIVFDIFVTESILPLINGMCIFFANDDEVMSQDSLSRLLNKNCIDILQTTPTKMRSYMLNKKNIDYLQGLKAIVLGGEEFPPDLFFELERNTAAKIFNIYGPAETTVWSSNTQVIDGNITIGKPIANAQIYILDKRNNPLPVGVEGELCIAGEGVGKGYLNRPDLTGERFVPNPFATEGNHHGRVMYHTGDLARWRVDGEIEYLGRIDTQVKIRGLRIELGEIENVMSTMEGIGLTAVTHKRDEDNRQYLVGYYTAETEINERKLREHLAKKLPKYMIPNFIMHLKTMPMTPSGKINRRNLPIPDDKTPRDGYIAPITDTEKRLSKIWQQIFHTKVIGREDDFYELGGDSLLAIGLLGEIESEFHVIISAKDILGQPKLEQLAYCIDQADEKIQIKPCQERRYILLPQQKAIYAFCAQNSQTLAYNMPARVLLPESVNRDRLKKCIYQVIENHKILKSHIRAEESEIYGIYDDEAHIFFEEYKEGEESIFIRPFCLESGPLIRIGFTEKALLFDIHHIIADGDSVNIILRDIVTVYIGKKIRASEFWYSDYARYFYKMDTRAADNYFKQMLTCDFEPVLLPETKNPRKGGKSKLYYIPEEIFQQSKKYAKKEGLTDTMVFLGAYGILLSKYTAEKDILTSIILQNRIHMATKDMVGMFVNTLPLYLVVKGDLSEYMQSVKRLILNLFRYQELPFWNIANAVGMKEKSVINTSFVYQGSGEKTLIMDGQELVPQSIDTGTAKFDLSMELTPLKNGCRMRMEFNLAKYDERLIDDLANGYIRILSQLDKRCIANICVFSEKELCRVTEWFNDTYVEYSNKKCIHQLFLEQAMRTPEKIALVFEDQSFTYRQLDEMSNSLGHFLRRKGVKRNDVVPVIASRSWHVIIAMLGIMKAGGAYMPIDPSFPEDRIKFMISEVKADFVLTHGYSSKRIMQNAVDLLSINYKSTIGKLTNINTDDDWCYLMFTSGSTGKPKAAVISHSNLRNFVKINHKNTYQYNMVRECSCVLADTVFSFDISIFEIVLPLLNGLKVVLSKDTETIEYRAKLIERNKVDVLHTTPTKLMLLLHSVEFQKAVANLKLIMIGAEKLTKEIVQEIRQYTNATLYNGYGPTEITIGCSFKKIERKIERQNYKYTIFDDDITIGRPIANTQIYILDMDSNPVPIGVPGELCVAGEGVGKGYLNRPELTAERFVPNPFATEQNHHGKVMYHTGDLARWRADGEIEYLGRMDNQVKIRGLRIELGEIESIMGTMDGIGMTAVTDKQDERGRQYLVGYYTAETEIDEHKLRKHLTQKLPKYMIPNFFMRLEAIPMTASGKTDRRNLPTPDLTVKGVKRVLPVTKTEKQLAVIWQKLLHVKQVGKTDDFFELGGDSLLAISMLNKIESEFQVNISMKDIMDRTLLEQLAQFIEEAEPLYRMTAYNESRYRLLPQQKAIYAVYQKNPDSLSYNMPAKVILPEDVDRNKLKSSIVRILERHKILKSYIQIEENEIYGVYDANVELEFEEYSHIEENAFVRPFNLNKAPLIRIGFTENALLFDTHHIVVDGDSVNIIFRNIMRLYQGERLKDTRIEYSDYARYFYKLDTEGADTFFREMLKCDFEPVLLPETKSPGKGGKSKLYHIPDKIFQWARKYAVTNGLTDTMVFLGAYGILLSKYTSRKDILSSIILQNRIHADTKEMVGMFVNTLPFYLAVTGSLSEYMKSVKQLILNLFQYQEQPFWNIANAVEMKDKSAVNTSFVYQGDGEKSLVLEGHEIVPQFMDTDTAKFDLSMELTPLKNGCRIRMEYNLAKYDERLVDDLADAYIRILTQMDKKNVADICAMSEKKFIQVTEEFNDTYVEYPREKCVHELFEERAGRMPDRTALIFEDKNFTYRQLDEMSNSLACFLREKGLKPNDVVPIIARRSWHVIVAMLGVMKAGGAYTLLDYRYPRDRIRYLLYECKAKVILVYGVKYKDGISIEDIDIYQRKEAVLNANHKEDICCAIHTSGSTGVPKLTLLTHANIVHYIKCSEELFRDIRQTISTTIVTFDAFIQETIVSLCHAIPVILSNENQMTEQTEFEKMVMRYSNSFIFSTPTKLLGYIKNSNSNTYLGCMEDFVLGGEIFPRELCDKIREQNRSCRIYNIYGPTETTVCITMKKVNQGEDITIGKPIANTQIYILDPDKNPVPVGVSGELCVAGEGVGKGYLNRPDLTAERFVPNPFATQENGHGKIMYRTGDLARWREDGEIEYLGRIDTQVKIRGLRIELGEIESVMGTMEGIGLTAVTDKHDEDNRQYLVGYYTAETEIDERKLREHLAEKLPKYMIPNYFMRLDAIPMTPSGKTDRKNLPVPDFKGQIKEYEAPVTEEEKALCHLLKELLGMERVGILDDFFEMGGDSLKAIEYMAKAHSVGIDFALQNVFDYPTVQSLCASMRQEGELKVRYEDADFDRYRKLFEHNRIDESFVPRRRPLGNILLTGATGFLGAHMVDELMREEEGKIYCLVRSDGKDRDFERVYKIFRYYFGDQYEKDFGQRIILIPGDIEREELSENMPADVQTVIHTAASVSHYGSYRYFHRVNVEGTRHVINYARSVGARLIHISTLSVSGNSMADDFTAYRSEEEKYFYETSFYIGQPLDNVYIHSKFEAEKAVYDAMLEGLDAKVIRVGNLTNRAADYKFQPNYTRNAFLTRVKAVLEFGLFPDYLMPLYSEFSPVDLTAQGIVKIAQFADKQSVFHLNSNRPIYFDRFLKLVQELGISMKVVEETRFNQALEETIQNTGTEYIFEALQNDMDSRGRFVYDSNIHIINDFTVWFLKKVGFRWIETDREYIKGYINYFRKIGYLEV